jgi:hyaluronoglucosaminidase
MIALIMGAVVLVLGRAAHTDRSVLASGPADFPFLFDIGGINGSVVLPPIPRVEFEKIFECPHPCGLMPSYGKDGGAINGGLPQLVNFTLHTSILNETFAKYVDIDDSRIVDFDFEGWSPVWNRNSNTSAYQNESRLLVQEAHPSWDYKQVETQAKLEFESSAKKLLIDTVAFIKSIRPSLKVGMYGFPTRYYYNGYNSSAGDDLRAENDALFPLWCSMDALFPSVYQFYNSCEKPATSAGNHIYVRSNVVEAVRIAKEIPARCGKNGKAPPVWVYTWHRYHVAGGLFGPFLCDKDEAMYWEESQAAGATGIVLWGHEVGTGVSEFKKYWASDFAPLVGSWNATGKMQ